MFLEFISNLPEKFRNISYEIQELPSEKPEMFLKNWESKKEENDRKWGLDPIISGMEGERSNHHTVLILL